MSEKLAAVVAELAKSRNFQKAAWQRVIDTGRQYAQMRAHGSYMENGSCISVCFSSRDDMANMFRDNLLRAVEQAYAEDAIVGAALANQT